MLSRSLDYGQSPYQSGGYSGNLGYSSDPLNLPTLSPYSFPTHQSNPYSFHKIPQQPQFSSYQSSPRQQQPALNQSRQVEGRNFVDSFDNNSSALLNHDKSHARNMKRLFENGDPTIEQIKQDQKNSYKEELQRQIEETRRRKQEEKDKIQKEEIERERKFYEEFKIQAQVKDEKGDKKEQNGYFMIRTLHKFKKPKDEPTQPSKKTVQEASNNSPNPPIKVRGKTYQNKSSLDTWDTPKLKPNARQNEPDADADSPNQKKNQQKFQSRFSRMEEEIMKERVNQEERLSKLLLFQQRVLQKISDIKVQIRNTAIDFDTDKELQRVRNNLKAKPIPFDDEIFKSSAKKTNLDMNHYYSLPKRELKLPGTRYSVKLKDSRKASPEKSEVSQITQYINDKNKTSKPDEQNQQNI